MDNNNNNNETIPHLIIRGKPYDRGVSYGQQMRDKIEVNLNYYKQFFKSLDWEEVHEFIDNNYVKAIEKYYPSGLLEMRGMADGAGMSLMDIIALNAIYEIWYWSGKKTVKKAVERDVKETTDSSAHDCTSAVCLSGATESGHVFMGQNWDADIHFHTHNSTLLLEVHPDPDENIAPFMMYTEAGGMGRIGMNANGLGITGHLLVSSDNTMTIDSTKGVLPVCLTRRLYIEAPNFAVALKRLLWPPRHVSNMVTVATAENEAINFEITPNDVFVTYPSLKSPFLTATNLFKSKGFIANSSLKDSLFGCDLIKDSQMQKALYYRCKAGTMTQELFEKAFTSHVGGPQGVCCHLPPKGRDDMCQIPIPLMSTANVIMNLTTKTLRITSGQPCVNKHNEYNFAK